MRGREGDMVSMLVGISMLAKTTSRSCPFDFNRDFCAARSFCMECSKELNTYARCIVESHACTDLFAVCPLEELEWSQCLDDNQCQ